MVQRRSENTTLCHDEISRPGSVFGSILALLLSLVAAILMTVLYLVQLQVFNKVLSPETIWSFETFVRFVVAVVTLVVVNVVVEIGGSVVAHDQGSLLLKALPTTTEIYTNRGNF